jgi:hypothetical protein
MLQNLQLILTPPETAFYVRIPELDQPTIAVYNMMGQKVYENGNVSGTLHQVNALGWPSGLYQYVITSGDHEIHNGKVNLVH